MHGIEPFIDTQIVMMGKLALAAFLGMMIGTERGLVARQAAGMRTFALVSLAACLLVVTGLAVDVQLAGVLNFDPMRMAAAIAQGIGFLGAGLIIFRGDSLHGVTTAAGLWVSAALGVAVGFGFYTLSIFVTLLTLLILLGLWYVEHRFKERLEAIHPGAEQPLGH